MDKVKISFIVPVYNVEDYLGQCVESILEQDYEEKEIILVDDGSTDSSGSICDEYAEKYENVTVIHKENGGASDARNYGLKKAAGEYILFVDADDFIEKNSLKKIVEIVILNNVDIVFLEANHYFDDGKVVPLGDRITKDAVYGKNKEEVLDFLCISPKYPASPCTKLIKRKMIIDNELWFEKGLLAEDLDWCMKLFLCAETFDYCSSKYYNYRQNRMGSASNTIRPQLVRDMLYILEKWSRIAETKSVVEKKFILSQMAYELPIVMFLYGLLDRKERIQFKGRIKKLLFLLKYRDGLKYKGVKFLCKILGIGVTSKLISIVYNGRRS